MSVLSVTRGVALAGLATLAGCASEYYPMRFVPARVEAPVDFGTPRDGQAARAHATASVRGIRKADTGFATVDEIEVELAVQNTGEVPLDWRPGQATLADGRRRRLPAPRIHALDGDAEWPAEGRPRDADLSLRLHPGERAESYLAFPTDDPERAFRGLDGGIGELDLTELYLGWTLGFEDRRVETTAQFGRASGRWARGSVRGSVWAGCW